MTTNFFTHARLAHGYWRAHEWGLDDQGFLRMIQQALALGIRVFDHAACYGGFTTEEMFGRGLALEPSLREQMCIVSKCGILFPNKALPWMKAKHYDNSRKHIVWSAERSVRSLQCGYLDRLLIHRPSPCANQEEIAGAFDELRRRGLVRRFGVSNFPVPKFRMLQSYLAEPLLTNQVEASPLHLNAFDDGTIDLALRMRIRPMVWSPLAGGRLFDTTDARSVRVAEALRAVGAPQGEERLDVLALAWLMAHPASIMPVVGSGNPARLRAAAEAVRVKFSEADWISVYAASQGHEVP